MAPTTKKKNSLGLPHKTTLSLEERAWKRRATPKSVSSASAIPLNSSYLLLGSLALSKNLDAALKRKSFQKICKIPAPTRFLLHLSTRRRLSPLLIILQRLIRGGYAVFETFACTCLQRELRLMCLYLVSLLGDLTWVYHWPELLYYLKYCLFWPTHGDFHPQTLMGHSC